MEYQTHSKAFKSEWAKCGRDTATPPNSAAMGLPSEQKRAPPNPLKEGKSLFSMENWEAKQATYQAVPQHKKWEQISSFC